MDQSLRPLEPVASSSNREILPLARSSSEGRKRKRGTNVRVACDACRARKCACDGARPVCAQCRQQGIECVSLAASKDDTHATILKRQNNSLKQELKDHSDILGYLMTASEQEAVEVLRRLKSTSSPQDALALIKGSAHNVYRPSEHVTARGILPATRYNLEFELAVSHQKAYLTLYQVDTSTISLSPLLRPTTRLSSSPREVTLPPEDPLISKSPTQASQNNLSSSSSQDDSDPLFEKSLSPLRRMGKGRVSSVSGPPRALSYYGYRLHTLEINYWTTVPITNEFAASAISLYLETDHCMLSFFDADLFFTHFVNQIPIFYVRASALSYAFFEEAKTLWLAEQSTDSIVTASASQILCIYSILTGQDELGNTLLRKGREMAERMNLFGVEHTPSLTAALNLLSPEQKRSSAYTAWGILNWQTLHALYYRDEAILFPPILPIPGYIVEVNDQKPTSSEPPQLNRTDAIFSATWRLWSIVQEIVVSYSSRRNTPLEGQVPHAFVETKYQQLLAWVDSLSMDLSRTAHSPAYVMILHMWFHAVVLDMFRPFLQQQQQQEQQQQEQKQSQQRQPNHLRSFASHDSSPEAVFAASLSQLKNLLIIYRQKFSRRHSTIYLNVTLLQVANSTLKDPSDPEWRFYFLLCLCFTQDLFVCYPIYEFQMQGFLAMAMQNGVMSSSEARTLRKRFLERGKHHEISREAMGAFAIDLYLAASSPNNARVCEIAVKFEELAVFDELTTGEFAVTTP